MEWPLQRSKIRIVREYVESFVVAICLALFIRTFVVQAFKIPSGSMIPTLEIGDHILVNKFIYGIHMPWSGRVLMSIKSPKRGDVIVFRFPKDEEKDFIKRVIGIPAIRSRSNRKSFISTEACKRSLTPFMMCRPICCHAAVLVPSMSHLTLTL